jgi:AraC-like DNA-binding protein
VTPDTTSGIERADRIFPDGAADIVISAGRASVYSAASSFRLLHLKTPVVGFRVRKGAAKVALRTRLAELGAGPTPMEMLWGRCARELDDRLAESSGAAEQIELLADFVRECIPNMVDLDQVVQRAIARIDSSPASTVRDLTRDIGLSERHLRRRFRDHVGLGIKQYARIVRFQRLLDATRSHKRLSGAAPPGWAGLAYEYGFADQAHLIEEVRAFAGVSPSELLLIA